LPRIVIVSVLLVIERRRTGFALRKLPAPRALAEDAKPEFCMGFPEPIADPQIEVRSHALGTQRRGG
jgi:hypothetical protein